VAERDPLSAVPVPASDTTVEPLPGGAGVLLTRRAPMPGKLGGWLSRRLNFQRERRYELDEVGACYWAQVDGARPLSEIQRTLCERYALSPEQARRAIVQFTAALMRRNLLALRTERT
jgi:hypothetical protein